MDLPGFVTLAYPEALLFGLALAWMYWRYVANKNFWRTALLALAVAALCYPALRRTTQALDLYILVDRSRSISDESRAKEMEIINLVSRNLQPGDRLGIVSFNDDVYIEQIPSSDGVIQSFQNPYSEDASDLAKGLETVLNVAPERRRSKIFILSDGEFTGQDPIAEAHLARQRKIPLFYRNLKRAEVFNLFIRDAQMPDKILENEPFQARFHVASTVDTPGRYRLYRDGRVVGESESGGWRAYNFRGGDNVLTFTDSLKATGIHSYKLEVETDPREKEILLRDNFAEKFVSVVGERPLLLVNNTGAPDNVSEVLKAGGLATHIVNVNNFRLGINQMEGYKGIILNNVALLKMSNAQIQALRDFVVQEGGGLLVTGGNNSFAMGGYYKTAIEPILPVSLEDRKQAKKIATAFSIVMDRSGSMSMTTPSGETKMALADAAAVECLKLLTPVDSLSVIAVDSAAHIIVPQQPADNPERIASQIRSIESMGGGIFTYTGLLAGGAEIAGASQLNKHILLFADSADAEEPGEYKTLLEKFERAGITVSVVGLGKETDSDAEFLKDVAKRGHGEIYFTEDASQLVQFFTADTIVYARQSFIPEPAQMRILPGAFAISPGQAWKNFSCGGYNLLFSKPDSEVAISTADEDNAPILAFWQRGLGRAASLALDADGNFSSAPLYGDVVLSAARWIMGSNVFDNFQIGVRTEGNYARIEMEVSDDEREKMGGAKLMIFTPDGKTIEKPLNWDSHNRLSASSKLSQVGAYRGVVQVGDTAYRIGPISMPVSPEFAYDKDADFGRSVLSQMAALTSGKEVLDVRALFDRSDRSTSITPFVNPLLIAFLILFLFEIAEARFGLLIIASRATRRFQQRIVRSRAYEKFRVLLTPRRAPAKPPRPKFVRDQQDSPASPAATPNDKPAAPSEPGDLDYLAKSKSRAGRSIKGRDSK